ncbi:MAG: esterase family protein [Bacteroidales bacterium]|nr:esterase family protein [Bacteroidales bacterium]
MQETTHKWFSNNIGAEITTLSFGHAGFPVVLFPTSMGTYYENKDFKLVESARWFIEQGLIKIYCPDSVDRQSWYNKGIHPFDRARNHIWYDKFLLEELVPLVRNETAVQRIAFAGCSFGAYHAMNFAFKHPDAASYVLNMGGAYTIKDLADGFHNDDIYFNNPVDFIPQLNDPRIWDLFVILGTGEHDICKDDNLQMAEILRNKNIEHWLDVRPGKDHDWPVWREMFPHYLSAITARQFR